MSLIPRALLAVSLAWAAAPCFGEGPKTEESETPATPVVTESVEVRSTLPSREDVAAFATRIDTADLREQGRDLADVLRRIPGAVVHDYGGLGSYATMSLRASTSEQVTVLVDGVPQNRALGGPVDLSSIPATQIADVTVFRGFGPAVYGLGGIGGVVDVRTRAPAAEPEASFDLVSGELATTRASAELSLPAGEGNRLQLGAEWLHSDGSFTYLDTGETLFNPADDVLRPRTNNEADDRSFLLQDVNDRVGGGRLRVALRSQVRERGAPGLGTMVTTTASESDALHDLTLDWTRGLAGAVEGVDLIANGSLQELGFQDPNGEIGLGAQDRTTRMTSGSITGLLHARLDAHRVLVRFEAQRESASVRDQMLDEPDRGGAVRDLVAVTAEDLVTVHRLTLAPSLRFEHLSDDFEAGAGGAVPPPASDVSAGAWSGKIGVAWALRPTASLRGSLGRFHRNPSLLELFGDRGSIRGNPALRPEQGLAAELGYEVSGGGERRWSGEIVAFARRSDDLIAFLPVAQGTAVARNVSRVETRGLEGALGLKLAPAWTLDATATVQEATDVSGGFSDGKPLPYQPKLLGYVGVGYRHARLRARWEGTYTGENSTDVLDTPALRLPERVIHDVNVSWELPRGVRIGVDVRNVFDRMTRDLLRYPLPGRVVLLHVGWWSQPGKRGVTSS